MPHFSHHYPDICFENSRLSLVRLSFPPKISVSFFEPVWPSPDVCKSSSGGRRVAKQWLYTMVYWTAKLSWRYSDTLLTLFLTHMASPCVLCSLLHVPACLLTRNLTGFTQTNVWYTFARWRVAKQHNAGVQLPVANQHLLSGRGASTLA